MNPGLTESGIETSSQKSCPEEKEKNPVRNIKIKTKRVFIYYAIVYGFLINLIIR
jgi:hypothetical protein